MFKYPDSVHLGACGDGEPPGEGRHVARRGAAREGRHGAGMRGGRDMDAGRGEAARFPTRTSLCSGQ